MRRSICCSWSDRHVPNRRLDLLGSVGGMWLRMKTLNERSSVTGAMTSVLRFNPSDRVSGYDGSMDVAGRRAVLTARVS